MNSKESFRFRLAQWISALSPTCRDATQRMSESLDHSLPFWSRLGLRIHLVLCSWCRRYGQQLKFLRKALRDHPDQFHDNCSHRLSAEARERLASALRQAPRTSQTPHSPEGEH